MLKRSEFRGETRSLVDRTTRALVRRARAEQSFADAQEVDHLRDREQRRDHEHTREAALEERAAALPAPRAREALCHARVLPLAGCRAERLQPRLHDCART